MPATQLRETVEFLYENGAKGVHICSACSPVLYSCKYLNFSRSTSPMDRLARAAIVELEGDEELNYLDEYFDGDTERGRKMREAICEKLHFATLEYQSFEGIYKAIGLEPCKVCTYC